MGLSLFLYLADLLTNLSVVCFIFCFILVFMVGIACIIYIHCNDTYDIDKKFKITFNKYITIVLKIIGVLLIIMIIIPTSKTMYLIAGNNYLNSTQIPTKVEKIINDKLDDYLTDDQDRKEKHT